MGVFLSGPCEDEAVSLVVVVTNGATVMGELCGDARGVSGGELWGVSGGEV